MKIIDKAMHVPKPVEPSKSIIESIGMDGIQGVILFLSIVFSFCTIFWLIARHNKKALILWKKGEQAILNKQMQAKRALKDLDKPSP